MKLQDLSPDSRLWLYQSDRPLSSTEIEWMNEQLDVFANEWAAHGTQLRAAGEVLTPYFIALAVDLTQANASGCSIDASVRFVKSAGAELGVDFFNRLKMIVESENGEHQMIPFRQVSEFPENLIFNPLVDRLGDLDTKFKVKAGEFLAAR